jgi:hypothetical protein
MESDYARSAVSAAHAGREKSYEDPALGVAVAQVYALLALAEQTGRVADELSAANENE